MRTHSRHPHCLFSVFLNVHQEACGGRLLRSMSHLGLVRSGPGSLCDYQLLVTVSSVLFLCLQSDLMRQTQSSVRGQSSEVSLAAEPARSHHFPMCSLALSSPSVIRKVTERPFSGKPSGKGVDFQTAILCLCLKCAK